LSVNSVVGPKESDVSPDKDGEAGDVGFVVDAVWPKTSRSKPDRVFGEVLIQNVNSFFFNWLSRKKVCQLRYSVPRGTQH
jgi:hypothetical protein